jgi:hypothetical protein
MTMPLPPAKPKRTGNYKAGPGRPPGRKNNRTLELEEAARQAAASLSGAFEGDAHAFLTAVYKNPHIPLSKSASLPLAGPCGSRSPFCRRYTVGWT